MKGVSGGFRFFGFKTIYIIDYQYIIVFHPLKNMKPHIGFDYQHISNFYGVLF